MRVRSESVAVRSESDQTIYLLSQSEIVRSGSDPSPIGPHESDRTPLGSVAQCKVLRSGWHARKVVVVVITTVDVVVVWFEVNGIIPLVSRNTASFNGAI